MHTSRRQVISRRLLRFLTIGREREVSHPWLLFRAARGCMGGSESLNRRRQNAIEADEGGKRRTGEGGKHSVRA